MGLFSSGSDKAQDRENVKRYKSALRDLDALADRQMRAGIRHETAEFHRLNDRVLAAEKLVPWWRRS